MTIPATSKPERVLAVCGKWNVVPNSWTSDPAATEIGFVGIDRHRLHRGERLRTDFDAALLAFNVPPTTVVAVNTLIAVGVPEIVLPLTTERGESRSIPVEVGPAITFFVTWVRPRPRTAESRCARR